MDKDKYFAVTGAIVTLVALVYAILVGLKRENTKPTYDIDPQPYVNYNIEWDTSNKLPRNIYIQGATLIHVTNDIYRYVEIAPPRAARGTWQAGEGKESKP